MAQGRIAPPLLAVALLVACSSGGPENTVVVPVSMAVPAAAPGAANEVPTMPAAGASRAGTAFDIYVLGPDTGDTIAFTVLEPATLESGKTYPLVLEHHGYSGSRQTGGSGLPSTSVGGVDYEYLREAGYGVVSIDERGHGESSGDIRAMDPDYEGRNLVAVLNWLDASLPWAMRGPDLDGGADNLVVGAIGGSYGGGFQLVLHAIDPRKRLDALVPHITWHDLRDALNPNGVPKSAWGTVLFAAGNRAGDPLAGDIAHQDPVVQQAFVEALTTNRVGADAQDFYGYHGLGYFCDGLPIATNGGAGTTPLFAPRLPTAVNAMFFQGMRDTLFNFTDAWRNAECLRRAGGDVRLLSYQYGHNALVVVPDPSGLALEPGGIRDKACGSIDANAATLAFFDEHLRGIPGAADAVVPRQDCISLAPGDAVLVDAVASGRGGARLALASDPVVTGLPPELPTAVPFDIEVPAEGLILAGIPRLEVQLLPGALGEGGGDPIVFVGLGYRRSGLPPWILIDNQIAPLRGFGAHAIDMVGVGERLAQGDELALLIYGWHDQYDINHSAHPASDTVVPVTLSGDIWLPVLGATGGAR